MTAQAKPRNSLTETAYRLFKNHEHNDGYLSYPDELFTALGCITFNLLESPNGTIDFNEYCELIRVVDGINEHLIFTNQI